eukprot:12491152-Ditylum_brightwellii.AAC.1
MEKHGFKDATLQAIFKQEDKMNVPCAIYLLDGISNLEIDVDDVQDALEQQRLVGLKQKDKFIQAQTYHDMQDFINSIFFCAMQGKPENDPSGFFELYIMLVGPNKQEELHEILHTLSHNWSFNMLELKYQLKFANSLMQLYEKCLEWRKKDQYWHNPLYSDTI